MQCNREEGCSGAQCSSFRTFLRLLRLHRPQKQELALMLAAFNMSDGICLNEKVHPSVELCRFLTPEHKLRNPKP